MMRKRTTSKLSNASVETAEAKDLRPIVLPKPKPGRAASVFAALAKRQTIRTISDKQLPLQVLSNLLWAACGINRKKGPFGVVGLTAASASNAQEIVCYVAMEDGIYLYQPVPHRLDPVVVGDFRSLAIGSGQANWGAKAPVRLVYVVDTAKFSKAGYQEPGLWDPEIQKSYYYADTGLVAANVYLFAASLGLAAWFHNCNRPAIAAKLKLRPDQRALFGQTIGYPKNV